MSTRVEPQDLLVKGYADRAGIPNKRMHGNRWLRPATIVHLWLLFVVVYMNTYAQSLG